MARIDRRRVQRAFTRHAGEYDLHADVQKRVIARMTGLLRDAPAAPGRVLDIGCGTGMLLRKMKNLFPAATLTGLDLAFGMTLKARTHVAAGSSLQLLTGDAEALPFRDHAFDLVTSTSTFQWLDHLDRAFVEAFRVLTPGGSLLFAMFGGKTLAELRVSYRRAWKRSGRGTEERMHDFHDAPVVAAALEKAGLTDARVWLEREVEYYPDVAALLRALKRIGAGNAAPPLRNRGLAKRRIMLDMMDIYQREYGVDGLIPATYEVIYCRATAPYTELQSK